MTRIGIVCGYDLNGDLQSYVDGVATELGRELCDVVIFSGGRTSPLTRQSEAATIAEGVQARVPELEIVLEERAMTTLDNLVFAKAIADRCAGTSERYAVFCDSVHERKVRLLSRMILGRDVVVFALKRKVSLYLRLFEPFSILVEALGVLSTNVRHLVRIVAVRNKGLSAQRRRSVLRAAASGVKHPLRKLPPFRAAVRSLPSVSGAGG